MEIVFVHFQQKIFPEFYKGGEFVWFKLLMQDWNNEMVNGCELLLKGSLLGIQPSAELGILLL